MPEVGNIGGDVFMWVFKPEKVIFLITADHKNSVTILLHTCIFKKEPVMSYKVLF
jgi:hypothetical protein